MAELNPCIDVLSIEAHSKKLNSPSGTAQQAAESENLIVKVPRANSKLILQNMEEVLNSVKKKHRQKHRRKREQRKLAMLAELKQAKSATVAEEISPEISLNGSKDCSGASDSSTVARRSETAENGQKKLIAKKPLQEQQVAQENSQSRSKRRKATSCSIKGVNVTGSELNSIKRAPTKRDFVEQLNEDDALKTTATPSDMPTKQTANAFEVMMNARNKSIGSNTPGKEPNSTDASLGIGSSEKSNAKTKRKLMLQTWADQKGGLKRKLDDELRGSFIENQLEKRAKRFKKMLMSGGSPQKKTRPQSKSVSRPATRSTRSVSTESSDDCQPIQPIAIDSETESFLSKLSSPTKKRDSLLGYFSKLTSPKEAIEKDEKPNDVEITVKNELNSRESGTSKRRSRPSAKKLENSEAQIDSSKTCLPQTPCGRPKRSCAGKTKYDYDYEVELSPKKGQNTPVSRRGKSETSVSKTPKPKSGSKHDIDVINLDDTTSPSELDCIPKKLAPLFTRNVPKPSPDPQALKARQDFLRSGVPEKLKIEQDKLKQIERNYDDSIEIYPKLSHLRQWSTEEHQLVSVISSSEISYRLKTEKDDSENSSLKHKFCISLIDCVPKDFCVAQKNKQIQPFPLLPIIGNKHQIVKIWKSDFERFPTYKCYNQLRAKYRFFSALDSGQDTTQVSESFVVTRSNRRSMELASATSSAPRSGSSLEEDIKPPETAPNGELLFVEKYKPLLFDQVLVNLTPISQLREFLANWASGSGGSSAKNSQNFADDSMDFLNDSSSSQPPASNSVVLLGPTASGKTNAVFTLANELNFNVLEINAGMKRTGKKLLQELQEATQSHQLRKDSKQRAATVKSKAQKSLLRLSLNDLKGKNLACQNGEAIDACNDLATRKCLILIEDADVVFEQTDAGFTDAIYSLAASSKRPVIVVAKDPNCAHLQRLMSQNTIKFSSPNPLSISKYLAVLSLMENCPVSLDDLISLFLFNQQDLRKTINELQFFIQSGGDREAQLATITLSNKSQNEKTPPKKNQKTSDANTNQLTNVAVGDEKLVGGKYFASPSKRRFSEDTQSLLGPEHDEKLERESHSKQYPRQYNNKESVCVHQSLFEFYTVDQNHKSRIPFPIDLNLFRLNLPNIFSGAKKLKQTLPQSSEATRLSSETKQKTRSPKKTWLSTATANDTPALTAHQDLISCKQLDSLGAFYGNVSVASLLVTRAERASDTVSQQQHDRLKPPISELIAHEMLELATNVNLDAELCPYNLFDAPKKRQSLCDFMAAPLTMQGKRACSTDVEPLLRAICRSEKQRAAQERKSTRFYHYLRNSCPEACNFPQHSFDSVCNVLQENDVEQDEHNQ